MKFKYTDYHVHTKWSHDIASNGPSFEDYVEIAEQQEINICFLDHYELYYIDTDKNYPFYGGLISRYLEEVDRVKENYEFILSGLEVDYYKEYRHQLREFIDDYDKEFDFIAGTIHETEYGFPFTTRTKLVKLLETRSVKKIVDDYFELMKEMIQSRIFTSICHIDSIYRYINMGDIKPTREIDISEERILELGRLCIKNDISIEYNLSGTRYPIGRTFPSKYVITQLKREGAQIFVGSDSHSVDYFRTQIEKVKMAYQTLEKII